MTNWRFKGLTLAATTMFLLGCGPHRGEPTEDDARVTIQPEAERDRAVREMLFRLLISRRPWVEVWFIQYGNSDFGDRQDPPPDFIKRLSDLEVEVKGVSSMVESGSGRTVRDRATGKRGFVAYARVVRWIDSSTAEVVFGCFRESEASSHSEGVVHLEGGKWVLTDEKWSDS